MFASWKNKRPLVSRIQRGRRKERKREWKKKYCKTGRNRKIFHSVPFDPIRSYRFRRATRHPSHVTRQSYLRSFSSIIANLARRIGIIAGFPVERQRSLYVIANVHETDHNACFVQASRCDRWITMFQFLTWIIRENENEGNEEKRAPAFATTIYYPIVDRT